MKTGIHEPRSMTIKRHVNDYMLNTNISEQTFAENVKTIYHDRVPDPDDRVIKFHEGRDAYEDMKSNGQLLFRMMKAHVKFPSDIEEPVVLALPDKEQRNLRTALAARYDELAVPIPHNEPEENIYSLSVLLKTTGATIESLAPILADNKIDEADIPHAKKALQGINQSMAELIRWQKAITDIFPDKHDN